MNNKKLRITTLIKGKIGNFIDKIIKFPKREVSLSGYTFIKDLTPSYSLATKKNRIGIYENSKGKRVVVKRVFFFIENLHSLYLRNEAYLLNIFSQLTNTDKCFPSYIDFLQSKNQIALVTEFEDGKNIETFNTKQQIELITKTLSSLHVLSSKLEPKFHLLTVRKPFYYLLSFFFNTLKVIMNNPSRITTYLSLSFLFYKNYSKAFFFTSSLGLVHRDLYPDNIMYSPVTKKLTITDWESAIISDSLYDAAQIAMIYTQDFGMDKIIELVTPYLGTNEEKRRFIALCIFNSMQILSLHQKTHPIFLQTLQFLRTLKNEINPRLFYKQSLYEKLLGNLLTTIYYFYRITRLPMYSRSKKIVLCYHSIGPSGWRYSMTPEKFKAQVEFLQKRYSVLPLPSFLQSKNGVTISFDDGYTDVKENALPILKSMNMQATMFALSDGEHVNRKDIDSTLPIMNLTDLKSLYKEGWTIGSHTATHSYTKYLSDIRLEEEIVMSKKALEKKLGFDVDFFAYPHGVYSKKIVSYVQKAGYKTAFTTGGYDVKNQEKSPFTINRILLEYSISQHQFEALLSPLGLLSSNIAVHVLQLKEMITSTPKNFFTHTWKSLKKFVLNINIRKVIKICFYIFITLFVLISSLVLCIAVVKGSTGKPFYYQTERDTKFGGPFELSISAGRFALTESIVKYHTVFLNNKLAKFSAPDVAEYNGKFISLFTPGLSFLGIPFYLLGLPFGIPQLSAYSLNIVLAVLNVFLIAILSRKFGGKYLVGLLGGMIFLFATNSLAYTSSFTQHHLTITLLLSLLLFSFSKRNIFTLFCIGLLYGFGVMVDIPNIFILFPILTYAFFQTFSIAKVKDSFKISVTAGFFALLVGLLPPLIGFGAYNYATTGSFTKVAQFIGQSSKFKPSVQNTLATTENPNDITLGMSLPFKTRNELHGFYILLLSDERSWIFYSPVILLGLLGLIKAYRTSDTKRRSVLAISVICTNIVLYSLFSDPWGGWAFGSRYLLPSAALLCVFLSVAIQRYRKNIFFLAPFMVLTAYSLQISLLGALTTIAIPPKVEAIHLLNPVPYTWQYNQNLLNVNFTSSLLYNVFLAPLIQVKTYFYVLYGYCAIILTLFLFLVIGGKNEK